MTRYCPCGRAIPPVQRQPSAAVDARIKARIEDIRWLLDGGDSPYAVAQRLMVRVDSLGRFLHRHGENDLARQFPRDRPRRAA